MQGKLTVAEKPGFRYTRDGLMGKSGISEKNFLSPIDKKRGKAG